MFLLGLISVAQICLLPGLILLKAVKYRFVSWIESLVLLFASSLLINYVLVFSLVAIHTYIRPVLLGISIIELGMILRLYGKTAIRWLSKPIHMPHLPSDTNAVYAKNSPLVFIIFGITLALCFNPVFTQTIRNIGTVFVSFDPAIAWNYWSTIWTQNMIPKNIGHYGQVLSTNWSISYVLMGNVIEFFPKATVGLFWIFIIAMLLHMATFEKPIVYIVAILTVCFFYSPFIQNIVIGGYAEIPVAFFWMCGMYMYMRSTKAEDDLSARWYLYASAFAFLGSALVKQTGLFMLVAFPLFLLADRRHIGSIMSRKQIHRFITVISDFVLVLIVPFYYICWYWAAMGLNNDEIQTILITMHNNRGLVGRFVYAMNLLVADIQPTWLLVTCALVSCISLKEKHYRNIFLLFVLPYTIIWAEFFSYETRLLLPVIPFFAISVGNGAYTALQGCIRIMDTINVRRWVIVVCVCAFLGYLSLTISDKTLVTANTTAKMDAVDPDVNHFLIPYFAVRPSIGMIFTDYSPITLFPGFMQRTRIGAFTTNADIDGYLAEIQDPEIRYVLMPTDADPRLLHDVDTRLKNGTFTMEHRFSDYMFLRITDR